MKLITLAVPCYNSQAYMRACIESLLPGGEDVEILIIDDGSSDLTGSIADEYEQAYPTIVRAIHQKNGGHGAGVNRGLENASGLYYKVVDSDDYLDQTALLTLLDSMKRHLANGQEVDLYITNFVYDHTEDQTRYVSHYRNAFPSGKLIGWEDTKPLRFWHVLLMHSIIYRTEVLKKAGIHLPEHTSYVDNLFAYQPLLHTKSLYYLDQDLYYYVIGRSDQSVTLENMSARYDQQIRVMSRMLAAHSYKEIQEQGRILRKQIYHYLHSIMINTYFFTTQKDEPERKARLKGMWEELAENDQALYHRMRRMLLFPVLDLLPWKLEGKISLAGYLFLTRHVKLG